MRPLNEKQIRSLLRDHPAIEPPADLGERLKAQIPEPLPSLAEPRQGVKGPDRRQWLLAASLIGALGVGGLSLYWTRAAFEPPVAGSLAEMRGDAAARRNDTRPETPPDVGVTQAEDAATRTLPRPTASAEEPAPEDIVQMTPQQLEATTSILQERLSRFQEPQPTGQELHR